MMSFNAFYPAALILFGIGAILRRDTDYFTTCGGDDYARKRTRRLVGVMILFTAALALVIALIS